MSNATPDEFKIGEWYHTFIDPSRSKISEDSIKQDLQGLKTLMREGAWKLAIKIARRCMINSKTPEEKLQYRLCALIGMMKMEQYDSAHSEFRDIGVFDDQKNLFQTFPEINRGQTGSMVPFNMRLIFAILPCIFSKDHKLEPLYSLLAYLRAQLPNENNPVTQLTSIELLRHLNHTFPVSVSSITGNTESLRMQIHRVIFAITSFLCQLGEFLQALELLREIIEAYPKDIILLQALTRIYLQIGNIKAAEIIINFTEQIITDVYPDITENLNDSSQETNSTLFSKKLAFTVFHLNRGLLSLSKSAYSAAVASFEKIIEVDPQNLVAVNNKALCYLYNGHLQNAMAFLESFFKTCTHATFNEEGMDAVVYNLCILYDLAWNDSLVKKRDFLASVAHYLPDHFNLEAFMIPELENPDFLQNTNSSQSFIGSQ